jgi:hypothetical protein
MVTQVGYSMADDQEVGDTVCGLHSAQGDEELRFLD